MRVLLILTAALEAGIGLSLLVVPELPISLLLGVPLDTSVGLVVARVAGAALLSAGIACWLARRDWQSRAARGLVAAMLLYNVAAVAILAHARFGMGLAGSGLWPAVGLHTAMAVWCVRCLRNK